MLSQLARAGDVIGMRVCFHRPQQLEPVFMQDAQIPLQLFIYWINEQGVAGVLVEQHVGASAGRRIKKLDRIHGDGL